MIDQVIQLGRDESEVRRARHWVARRLRIAGFDKSDFSERIIVGVSELVSNVLLHTDSLPTLLLRASDWSYTVEVHDDDPRPPRVRPPGDGRPGGFGLRVVEACVDTWGVRMAGQGGGKTVWFTIGVPRPSSPGNGADSN